MPSPVLDTPPAPVGAAVPGGPTLILLPSGTGGDRVILGLDLAKRLALAAARAGFGGVFCLSPADAARTGVEALADWRAPVGPEAGGMIVMASSHLLGETAWLKRLATSELGSARWAAAGNRLVAVSPGALPEALAALNEDGAKTMADAVACLTARLGAPVAMPPGIDPMAVETAEDAAPAERILLRALIKDTDGFMARHVDRAISLSISRRLAATAVTPNQMTLVSVAIGIAAAPFFLSASPGWQTLGALLFLAHSILDGCDGELARLKFKESRWGGLLDFWGDNVVHSAVFACMAAGWSGAIGEGWPLLLGALAVLATLGSAGLVYWRVMRPKVGLGPLYTSVSTAPDRRFARLMDALSRRDFIYIVLLLALFGRAHWFLLLTALGAPVYLAMLVFLALRERVARKPEPRTI